MKIVRSIPAMAAAATLAVATLGAAGVASAQDVYWSVGVSSPGVRLGVSNAPPVVVHPQPVYVQTQPVYAQPVYNAPVYVPQRPVYVQPRPVYVPPQPVVYYVPAPVAVYPGWRPGDRHGWEHRHGRDHDWGRDHGHGHGRD